MVAKHRQRCGRPDKNLLSLSSNNATSTAAPRIPLCITETPLEPWQPLHMDFCGPFPTGEMFVLIHSYSKFPDVEIMQSTTALSIKTRIDKIFATHGLPIKITSDNGPPFNSRELVASWTTIFKNKGLNTTRLHHIGHRLVDKLSLS